MSDRVIVRGFNSEWLTENFREMEVYFSGRSAVPVEDADFIGFYIEAPVSAITHLGVVNAILRDPAGNAATFFLKAIIKLDEPIRVADHPHGIRKHEYWTLAKLGIQHVLLEINNFRKVGQAATAAIL
jgi:hypothetical protein